MDFEKKPAGWAWRFPDGKLSSPYKNHSLCTYLHEGHAGHLVSLVVQEEGQAQELPQNPITEEMHQAACRVLTRAQGLDGTPQRLLDAMRAVAPKPGRQVQPAQDQVTAAVLAEREACAKLMSDLREKSRNHLFRSALTVAEGEIRARGKTTRLPADDTEGGAND